MNTKLEPIRLSDAQLRLMMSMKNGFEYGFKEIFLRRCAATVEEWDVLEKLKWIKKSRDGWRIELTKEGNRQFNQQRKGRYF